MWYLNVLFLSLHVCVCLCPEEQQGIVSLLLLPELGDLEKEVKLTVLLK